MSENKGKVWTESDPDVNPAYNRYAAEQKRQHQYHDSNAPNKNCPYCRAEK